MKPKMRKGMEDYMPVRKDEESVSIPVTKHKDLQSWEERFSEKFKTSDNLSGTLHCRGEGYACETHVKDFIRTLLKESRKEIIKEMYQWSRKTSVLNTHQKDLLREQLNKLKSKHDL